MLQQLLVSLVAAASAASAAAAAVAAALAAAAPQRPPLHLRVRWPLLLQTALVEVAEKAEARQWPKVSDFVARFFTFRESKNLLPCENCV